MLLACNVTTLVELAGLVAKVAVKPVGKPEACRLTPPVKPYRGLTVMVEVALAPWFTVRPD